MYFPRAAQIARLEPTRDMREPEFKTEVFWLITSLEVTQGNAEQLLPLARAD